MENILDRIKQLCDNESITITELERKISASKGVLSRALAKKTDIQSKWITKIVENYQLYNPSWLLTGKGEMLLKKELDPKDHVSEVSNMVSLEEYKKQV